MFIKEMKNRKWNTFFLTLIVFSMLTAMFYLPRTTINGTDLRRVNIMSDIQQRNKEGNVIAEVRADSIEGFVEQKIDSAAIEVK